MNHKRKHNGIHSLLRSGFAALLLAAGLTAGLLAGPAKADTIAADGSVGVNTQWEDGQSTMWYIELQRQGEYDVTGGIETENDAEIREGLLQFDWGFEQQADDGSFPGTAGGSTGQMFHSTSLFIEAVARCTLLLKNYNPTTYTKDSSYYNGKISTYTTDCEKACQWLTEPSVQTAGQAYNLPYTHRRYLLAACLAQTAALSGDTTLNPIALSYAEDGISLQLGPGWLAAVPAAVDGVYPAATLIAPGAAVPQGTAITLKATGVDPELNGYDSGYQCLGLFYANTYLPYCTDSTVKKELLAAIKTGLHWEQWFILPTGTITITGDSRMGIETDREGNVKEPTIPDCWAAYSLAAQNTGDTIDTTYATRIGDYGEAVDTNTIHTSGAVDGNEAWEQNHSLPWSISNQKIGVDWIERGIATENDSDIQEGIKVINWGFDHQDHNIGSFGTSQSPFYGAAQFVETAARAAEELKSYKPVTYTPTTDYASWADGVLSDCDFACKWMTLSSIASHNAPLIADSTCRQWTLAAALAVTGDYADDSKIRSDANAYAENAIALQLSSGEEPEAGVSDVDYQALGMYEALHYSETASSSSDADSAKTAVNQALIWEGGEVSAAGVISGTSSAPLLTMQNEYSLAVSDNLDDAGYFQTVRYRLGGIPVE